MGNVTPLDFGTKLARATSSSGFMDYNDAATVITPITLVANTWTTLTNDGAGPFTNKLYKPFGVTELLDTATGFIEPAELQLGTGLIIRNDYTVTPATNNQLLEFRYSLGAGGSAYTLETALGRLDAGSSIPYRNAVSATYIYLGDSNTQQNSIKIQIRTSGNGTVVNSGSAIQVIGR